MLAGFNSGYADVNGTRLHYVTGGDGDPLVLLPGWPRTWWQFHKLMPILARQHRVIAIDLRGMGDSDKPESGYDKKSMARDVYELVRSLGHERVNIAGEDIGSMVAYSFAANHPDATEKLALWEPGHPNESFRSFTMLPVPDMPHLWWFALNQVDELPEKLLTGRFRLIVDHLIDQMGDPASIGRHTAISEYDRSVYAAAYDAPGAVRAANGWYKTIGQDIDDAAGYPVLTMPVLGLGGIYFPFVKALTEGRAADIRYVEFPGAGHYLSEERPEELAKELLAFFS
jgi:pimeloyl-ACP methyl ester carboxylesterase